MFQVKAVIRWMLGSLAFQEPVVWALTTLAVASLVSCLASVGPQLQAYLVSFIADGASIYGSANGDVFQPFFTYRDWVSQAWTWPIPMFGLVITIASLRTNRLNSIILGCVLSAFLVQSLYDFTVVAWSTNYSLQFVMENILGNFVGAGVIAFVLITCLYSYEWIFFSLESSQTIKFSIALLVFPMIGFLCLSFSFYFTRFLYEPTKVRLDLSFDIPVSGEMILPDKEKSTESTQELSAFNWSSSQGIAKKLKWDSLFHPMEVKWEAPSSLEADESFDVKAYLLGDCAGQTDIDLVELPEPLHLKGVKSFKIKFDAGSTDFYVVPQNSESIEFDVNHGSINSFQLIQYEDKEKMEQRVMFARYLDTPDELSLPFQLRAPKFSLTAPLMVRDNNQIVLGHRRIYIETDKESVTRAVGSAVTIDNADDLNCMGFDWGGRDAVRSVAIGKSKYVSVFIKIESPLGKSRYPIRKKSYVTVAGGRGWLYASDIHPDNTVYFDKGIIKQFNLQGSLKHLSVDGVLIPIKANEKVSAIGDFVVSVERGIILSVSGSAKSIWRDNVRSNPTRWERLSIEGKLFIVSLAGVILAAIFRLVVRRSKIRADIKISPNFRVD